MTQRALIAFILAAAPIALPAQDLPGGRAVDVDLNRAQFNAVMIKAIKEAATAWQEAWKAGPGNQLAAQYSEEATLLQPSGELVSGSAAIRAATDSLMAYVSSAELAFADYESSEGIAYFSGLFSLNTRSPSIPSIDGQHLTVLKRDRSGYRIRMQLFHSSTGATHWSGLPALHPAGPLTRAVMSKPGSVERYRSANALIHAMRQAWAQTDTAKFFSLFEPAAVIQLPGQTGSTKVVQARNDVLAFRSKSDELHMVTLDYDNSGRITAMVGRYLFQLPSEKTIEGYFAMILTGRDEDWKVRALIFL